MILGVSTPRIVIPWIYPWFEWREKICQRTKNISVPIVILTWLSGERRKCPSVAARRGQVNSCMYALTMNARILLTAGIGCGTSIIAQSHIAIYWILIPEWRAPYPSPHIIAWKTASLRDKTSKVFCILSIRRIVQSNKFLFFFP